ncbi:MAG: HNH endonuclease, partial [Pseudobdellovibrionaceae bacterium]
DLFLRLCEKLIKSKTQLNKSAQSKTQPSKSARSNGQPSRGVGFEAQPRTDEKHKTHASMSFEFFHKKSAQTKNQQNVKASKANMNLRSESDLIKAQGMKGYFEQDKEKQASFNNQTQTSATQGVLGAGTRSRYIPQHIRKAVFARDGFQCRFKTEEGHICGSRMFLQPHHIKAFAKGGEHTLANLSLRCHAHNQFEAKLEGLERKVPFTV